ncbi:hypothetical protein ABL78_7361 [Leptomonas seymouri]|uniref:Uncharacterized protein n=1 Tax=Leptomonas seymouri TaxID=5684 RepID=A0A0N1PAC4_LEPSE|nr:hypothetical protein ABL78_7361 [Leptomonas seymouri]|eukprot:KPI83608.1 hypothetical protein ABL78_7361 [Leptomonas seymouri]
MPPTPSSSTPATSVAVPLAQRLQLLQRECGGVYETYAPVTSSSDPAANTAAKKLGHRERSRLQHLVTEQVSALYKECFSSAKVQLADAELEQLLRLLPSLVALSAPPTLRPPLLMIVIRVLNPQKDDSPAPQASNATLEGVLHSLALLLLHPDPWATGEAPNAAVIRGSAASLLAQLLRYVIAHAPEAVVEAQWRQWQELAHNTLLDNMRKWVEELDAQRPQTGKAEAHKQSMPAKPPPPGLSPSAACVLCQLLDLIDALVEHPCARSLPHDAWLPALSCVAHLAGSPQSAPQHLELSYAVLQVLTHVREKGVVSPGMWRQLALDIVAKSIPHGPADAPVPIPVSSISPSTTTYATLFLKYVHFVKSVMLLPVEEHLTDSSAARNTAAQLHTVLAELVELSTSVFIDKGSAAAPTAAATSGLRVSLLAAVVKCLFTGCEESRTSPRQYSRYVYGMLAGSAPLVPYIIKEMAMECYRQTPLLDTPNVASMLSTNAEILQGVFLWAIHAIIDEGLLDSTRHSAVAAALPYVLYDSIDAILGQLNERFAMTLLSNSSLPATKDVPLLAARVIAHEGLALLLHLLLFVVVLHGIPDEVSWNVRFRDRLYATETRVMRTVGAFDCGVPQVLRTFTDALERVSSTLRPTAARISTLLPSPARPSLVSAGCHGALEKLLEVLPIF